jgi:hypothetical protein
VFAADADGSGAWVNSGVMKRFPESLWPPDDLQWTRAGLIFSSRGGLTCNVYRCPLNEKGIATGDPVPLTNSTEAAMGVSVSRNGRAAFASQTERFNIWALPLDTNTGRVTGSLTRITEGFDLVERPTVDEDGRTVYFSASRNGRPQFWRKDIASGREQEVAAMPANPPRDRSPDGKLRYTEVDGDSFSFIRVTPSVGLPFAIYNDTYRLSLRHVNPASQRLTVARDKIVMIVSERTSNIWLMDLHR